MRTPAFQALPAVAWMIGPTSSALRATCGGNQPSAAFVLQSATTHAAELLRRSADIGSLEAGKFADIIGVEGDPLADISRMRQVEFVMKGGVVYKDVRGGAGP